jgi:hypothetical protein
VVYDHLFRYIQNCGLEWRAGDSGVRRSDCVDAMTHTSSTSQARGVVFGLLVASIILIVEYGAWSLVTPHSAPEIGQPATFIVLSLVLAAYFVPSFLLVACPFLWLAGRVSTRRLWPISAVAALLVAGTVFTVSAGLHEPRRETLFIAALSLLPAGIGASVVLRRWNLSSPRGNQIA